MDSEDGAPDPRLLRSFGDLRSAGNPTGGPIGYVCQNARSSGTSCLGCGTPIRNQWAARGYCAECEEREAGGLPVPTAVGTPPLPWYFTPRKSRTVSVGLSLVLGGIGAHKFYLGKPGVGFLYFLFCAMVLG